MPQLPPNPEVLDRAVGRARRRLIPFMLLMYVLSYLDRANIGYAKQAYQAATGVTEAAFAFGAGAFFLTYALFEIPSNLIMHRVGARIWMARIMIVWGLCSAAMAFAKNDTSFSVIRLFLGAAEAGFFPGSILFFTWWFPASVRGQVMGIFYFGSPLALMLGGPLSGILLEMDGKFGLQGWQLMFVVEGLMASLVGIWAFFYLTDRPANAAWMPKEEREALTQAIAAEEDAKQTQGTVSFGAVFSSPRLLHFATIYFLIQVSGYGVAFYLPTRVSALLGVKVGLWVGIISAIPWACAIIAATFWPALAMRTGYRRTFACISLLGITAGLCLSANLPPVLAIAAMCLVTAGIISGQPIFWTFPTAYFGGIGAAAGIATINALGNLGGLAAPTAKTWLEQKFNSTNAGLYFLASSAFLAAILVARLHNPDATETRHH
jgi:sugar phosphate permease